jgi:hypothetical protein
MLLFYPWMDDLMAEIFLADVDTSFMHHGAVL